MARTPTCICGTCKKCKHREYVRRWYWQNRDRACEIARAGRLRRVEAARAYDRNRGYRAPPPDVLAARNAVNHAVHRGRLEKQPCEVCGDPSAQAHHEDYSRPLAVRWLCAVHHGIEHRTPIAIERESGRG